GSTRRSRRCSRKAGRCAAASSRAVAPSLRTRRSNSRSTCAARSRSGGRSWRRRGSSSIDIGKRRSGGTMPPMSADERPTDPAPAPPQRKGHFVVWLGLATKLFQSGKVLKVVLAGVAVSGWTVLYSLPFALALTATLVFHEWGHLRAMRRFGIPTKGMYLIPFVGGIAVGEQARTHWEDVYISMMGPVHGLVMTAACYLLYLATENHLVGLVASVSALVNVFNLLPIHPLDGGRVVKALVFSARNRWAFLAFAVASAAFFAVSVMLGLALLTFFI